MEVWYMEVLTVLHHTISHAPKVLEGRRWRAVSLCSGLDRREWEMAAELHAHYIAMISSPMELVPSPD
jgi:hypothetical protein